MGLPLKWIGWRTGVAQCLEVQIRDSTAGELSIRYGEREREREPHNQLAVVQQDRTGQVCVCATQICINEVIYIVYRK